ncbi:MAG: LysR family transcriptional regulator [Dehalococcoidia bacterium]
MELQDVEAFIAVTEHGGFRAAADALFLSQPSLTRRIKRLEEELEVELLDRGPRGVRLTGHGEAFLEGARRILMTVDEVRAATVGAWGETITIGAAATAAGSYLSGFLSTWIPQHPKARLTMIEDGALRLRGRLADRECDAAILAAPIPAEFDSLPITRVGVRAVFPPDHPLARSTEPLSVSELAQYPLLMNGSPFLSCELTLAACRVIGVQPEVVYECSVGQSLAALAEAGLGVAILSDNVDLRGFDLPSRAVCDGDLNRLHFSLHIAWLRERTLPSILYEFVEDLSEFTRDLRMKPLKPLPAPSTLANAPQV